MYFLYLKKSNEILSPSSSYILRSVTGLLLKSYPDNRWCFRGQGLGNDPGAEQRALEEQRVHLNRGAVTSKHELNFNQPSGNIKTTAGLLKGCSVCFTWSHQWMYSSLSLGVLLLKYKGCALCVWHHLMVTSGSWERIWRCTDHSLNLFRLDLKYQVFKCETSLCRP